MYNRIEKLQFEEHSDIENIISKRFTYAGGNNYSQTHSHIFSIEVRRILDRLH